MEFLSKYQLLELMSRFESNSKISQSKIIFRFIKPYILEAFENALKIRKTNNRGSPRKTNLNQFLDIYYGEFNSGIKISDLMEIYGS